MSKKIFGRQFLVGVIAGSVISVGAWLGPQAWHAMFVPAPVKIAQPPPPPTPIPEPPRERPVEDEVVPPPVVVQPPPSVTVQKHRVDEAAEAAATLARYAQSCKFWSDRSGDAAGRIYRKRACRQMRDYAKSTGQRAPSIKADKRRAKITASKPKPAKKRVVPNECTKHDYGSVRYRQCRAQESQRLKKMCQFHQQREERREAADWCAAYESYQIVK